MNGLWNHYICMPQICYKPINRNEHQSHLPSKEQMCKNVFDAFAVSNQMQNNDQIV